MLNANDARQFANRYIDAFNSRSIDRIMSLYADRAEVVSQNVIQILKEPGGRVNGQANIRDYFTKALAAYPYAKWQLIEVTYGLNCVVAYYVNEKATRSCEVLELDAEGKILRHIATYS
jgi:hypothetical protein